MSTEINPASECKRHSLRKKSSIRDGASYRIIHITNRVKEDSDEEEKCSVKACGTVEKENECKTKHEKRSFKIYRNGLDAWRRKSTKNKRLLFLHKTSCESTSNEHKTPPLNNDLSSSIISNDAALNPNESSESEVLVDEMNEKITQHHATLNNLLVRANQLETTVKKPEFNKIQPPVRVSIHRRRKRFLIACGAILIVLTLVISIVLFALIMTLRYKKRMDYTTEHPSLYDV